jgi:hypothetical protein
VVLVAVVAQLGRRRWLLLLQCGCIL